MGVCGRGREMVAGFWVVGEPLKEVCVLFAGRIGELCWDQGGDACSGLCLGRILRSAYMFEIGFSR